ncbi:MAG: ABC transporter substrate-binding protein, partial [Acetobacteraceae bacterium]|nr:ABC transporter substrate-binding protein [Acetobacteraceae bacterium]
MLRRLMAAALLLLPFAACAPQVPPPYAAPSPYPRFQQPPVLPRTAPEKVGLLLPLSGSNRMLGQAMLNAAQLALFDQGDPRVELLPRDTRSTAAGAAEAARAALADGARALAGPPTLGETGAAAAPARAAGAPLFAFTNDAAQAGSGVWVLGMTPTEQADRLATAA